MILFVNDFVYFRAYLLQTKQLNMLSAMRSRTALARMASRSLASTQKRFIYEDNTHYEGMIRERPSDPRLDPHPDTYVDGIFRWPHTPEFNEPVTLIYFYF